MSQTLYAGTLAPTVRNSGIRDLYSIPTSLDITATRIKVEKVAAIRARPQRFTSRLLHWTCTELAFVWSLYRATAPRTRFSKRPEI